MVKTPSYSEMVDNAKPAWDVIRRSNAREWKELHRRRMVLTCISLGEAIERQKPRHQHRADSRVVYSEEARKNCSKAAQGKKHTDEMKAKQRATWARKREQAAKEAGKV